MINIFKYPVEIGKFTIKLPKDFRILSVQMQRDNPFMWIIVDTETDMIEVDFITRGTGHEFEETEQDFVGTFQMAGGSLIWHLFRLF